MFDECRCWLVGRAREGSCRWRGCQRAHNWGAEGATVKESTCLEDSHVGEIMCGSLSAPFFVLCCEEVTGEQSGQKVAQPQRRGLTAEREARWLGLDCGRDPSNAGRQSQGVEASRLAGMKAEGCAGGCECLWVRDAARSFKNYGQMVECVRVDLDRQRTPPASVPLDIALQAGRVVSVPNAGACATQHVGRFEGEFGGGGWSQS